MLTQRELDCVLAALHFWRWRRHQPINICPDKLEDAFGRANLIRILETQEGKSPPLSDDEILALCDKLESGVVPADGPLMG